MGREMPQTVNGEPAEGAPLWDDDKFIARVKALVAAKGMTLAAVSRQAGLSEEYFVKRGGGRGRNIVSIVRLASALGVPVSVLVDRPANPPEAEVPPSSSIDPVKLERLALVANVAAHLYLTLDGRRATVPDDIDAEELLQLLMRFVEPPKRPNRR